MYEKFDPFLNGRVDVIQLRQARCYGGKSAT